MAHTPARQRDAWRKAEQVRAQHADAVQTINGRKDLSAEGRRRQLAQVTRATRDRLAELRQADAEAITARQERLIGDLFKPSRLGRTPSGDLAERDAASRCASIRTADDARKMLRAAAQLDDRSLARAAARRVADIVDESGGGIEAEQFQTVLDEWAGSSLAPPYAAEAIGELLAIEAEQLDGMTALATGAHYRPDMPSGIAPGQLDRLADEADPIGDKRELSRSEQVGQDMVAQHHRYVEAQAG
jgi:hypothetical protein